MNAPEQPILVDVPEQPLQPQGADPQAQPKLRFVNRLQMTMAVINVEDLIAEDHKARAIWELTGRLDLSRFLEPLRTSAGCAGRSAWAPRLLVSIWVYAYSEGILSAREIERLMEWERGLQWLGGLESVNHHTLSDFRVAHKAALDELFAQLLAMLEGAGLVDLKQVMHDGGKIRAQTGADSPRREKTLLERLDQARRWMAENGGSAGGNIRQKSPAGGAGAGRSRADRTPGGGAERTGDATS